MPRNRLAAIALVVVAIGLAGWWFLRSGAENVAVDLIEQLPSARQQQFPPEPSAFTVDEVRIGDEAKSAIVIRSMAGTRLTWKATIPDNGWLSVSLALLEEGWTMTGDGVTFSIGMSDGQVYDELLSLTLNPFANASDRRWNDIELDLAPYAGETMDIIFRTVSGPTDDRNGDFAVWAEPRIVVK